MPRQWQARASGSSYFGTSARRPASARIPARIAVMPTLLIADDHPLFRAALRQAAADAVDALQVREADSLESVLAALDAEPRSEERRVGEECVSTCRYRWSPYN